MPSYCATMPAQRFHPFLGAILIQIARPHWRTELLAADLDGQRDALSQPEATGSQSKAAPGFSPRGIDSLWVPRILLVGPSCRARQHAASTGSFAPEPASVFDQHRASLVLACR
jgi:hypothetical protein